MSFAELPPYLNAVHVSFISSPLLQIQIIPLKALDINSMPWVAGWLNYTLSEVIKGTMVMPQRLSLHFQEKPKDQDKDKDKAATATAEKEGHHHHHHHHDNKSTSSSDLSSSQEAEVKEPGLTNSSESSPEKTSPEKESSPEKEKTKVVGRERKKSFSGFRSKGTH